MALRAGDLPDEWLRSPANPLFVVRTRAAPAKEHPKAPNNTARLAMRGIEDDPRVQALADDDSRIVCPRGGRALWEHAVRLELCIASPADAADEPSRILHDECEKLGQKVLLGSPDTCALSSSPDDDALPVVSRTHALGLRETVKVMQQPRPSRLLRLQREDEPRVQWMPPTYFDAASIQPQLARADWQREVASPQDRTGEVMSCDPGKPVTLQYVSAVFGGYNFSNCARQRQRRRPGRPSGPGDRHVI